MGKRANLIAVAFLLGLGVPAGALEIALPQGAREVARESEARASYALPVAPFDGQRLPVEAVEGAITREAWRLESPSVTNLQIIAPIRTAMEAAGYEILLDCAALECGGFDFRFATEVMSAPAMFVSLSDFRFLSGRGPEGALSVLVSGTASARFIQIIRVGEGVAGSIETSLPVPPPTAGAAPNDLTGALEQLGHVVLSDLAFETGSSNLSAGPYASLETLAGYLLANPGRRIALVGHTDATGGLNVNVSISQRRAEAVRTRLIETYGVPASQMEAGGMGYLAPRASNLTEEGRGLNRRVEAVLISTQ